MPAVVCSSSARLPGDRGAEVYEWTNTVKGGFYSVGQENIQLKEKVAALETQLQTLRVGGAGPIAASVAVVAPAAPSVAVVAPAAAGAAGGPALGAAGAELLEIMTTDLETTRVDRDGLRRQLDAATAEIEQVRRELTRVRDLRDIAIRDGASVREERDQVRFELARTREERDQGRNDLNRVREERDHVRNDLARTREDRDLVMAALNRRPVDMAALTDTVVLLQSGSQDILERIMQLSDHISTIRDITDRSRNAP
jgi:hypothetical protein